VRLVTVDDQPPPDPLPKSRPGFKWREEDSTWRLATAEEWATRKCRRPHCQRSADAAFNRGYHSRHGKRASWWLYCSWHLYGRKIEDGRVLVYRPVVER